MEQRKPLAKQFPKDPEHAIAIAICLLAQSYPPGNPMHAKISEATSVLLTEYRKAEPAERAKWGRG